VSQGLERVRQAARQRKKERFTALLHHVTIDRLRESFFALKRNAALGMDGVTWRYYEAGPEEHLERLHAQVQSGAYRALPVRRRYISKPDGKQRPLGIAGWEDKIVRRAVVDVLNAIYEEDFLGFSYGFRPARSQHDALDALATALTSTPVNWILDADRRARRRTQCGQQETVPNASLLPRVQTSPATHPGSTAHFLGQHLPGNAGLQDENKGGEHRPIVQRPATGTAGAVEPSGAAGF
jgi:hypothetical protein